MRGSLSRRTASPCADCAIANVDQGTVPLIDVSMLILNHAGKHRHVLGIARVGTDSQTILVWIWFDSQLRRIVVPSGQSQKDVEHERTNWEAKKVKTKRWQSSGSRKALKVGIKDTWDEIWSFFFSTWALAFWLPNATESPGLNFILLERTPVTTVTTNKLQ